MRRCYIAVLFILVLLVSNILVSCASPPEGTVEWHLEQAHEMATKGHYDAAIDEYTKVIELDSGQAIAYVNRAAAYASIGQ